MHLASVRAEADAAHEDEDAKYPSLLVALGELGSGAKLTRAWEALRAAGDALDAPERELAVPARVAVARAS